MKDFQYITNSTPNHIESLYQDFVNNPESVDIDLRKFFEGFDFAVANMPQHAVNGKSSTVENAGNINWNKEFAVFQLIQAYRKKAHLVAKTNPIRERRNRNANLELSYFGLFEADLNTTFESGNFIGAGKKTLSQILANLQKSYAHHIGLEFGYINDAEKIEWLTKAMEQAVPSPVDLTQKKRILQKLN